MKAVLILNAGSSSLKFALFPLTPQLADAPRLSGQVEGIGAAPVMNARDVHSGERYTEATIRERLTLRDFMDTMRSSGIQTGGPSALSQRDRQQFASLPVYAQKFPEKQLELDYLKSLESKAMKDLLRFRQVMQHAVDMHYAQQSAARPKRGMRADIKRKQ